jgi:hypothetical protein
MGLEAFPPLLTVLDDDTCCLLGSSDRVWGLDRYRSYGERLSVPRPETRGDVAWRVLQNIRPRGGAAEDYRRGREGPARPATEDVRAWYEEHKAYTAEKLDLMYLREGDAVQTSAAMKRLLAADKDKHRQAVADAVGAADENVRIELLTELAKLDRPTAVAMLREMVANSERWTADRARQVLKSLGEKVAPAPKVKEPKEPVEDEGEGENKGVKEGKAPVEALPAEPPTETPSGEPKDKRAVEEALIKKLQEPGPAKAVSPEVRKRLEELTGGLEREGAPEGEKPQNP